MARKSPAKKKQKARAKYHKVLYEEFPINARGDRTGEPLALAVAGTLSSWEAMDERLSFLFAALVQSKNGAAMAAYGVLNSFGTQTKMIQAASEAVFRKDHPLRPRIATLLNELNALHGKRSNVAHGIIRQYNAQTVDKRGRARPASSGFFLSPPLHNTRKQLSLDEMNGFLLASPRFLNEFHRWRKHAYTSKQVQKIDKVIQAYTPIIMEIYIAVVSEMRKREKEREVKVADLRERTRQERVG